MAWLAVDKDGTEVLFINKPGRLAIRWEGNSKDKYLNLPKGSIKALIGRELSWNDEPVELKDE